MIKLIIRDAFNLELRTTVGLTSSLKNAEFRVQAAVTDGEGKSFSEKWQKTAWKNGKINVDTETAICTWETQLALGGVTNHGAEVEIVLRRDFGHLKKSHNMGRAVISVRELMAMPDDGSGVDLMMFDGPGNVITGGERALPTIVRVSLIANEESQPSPNPGQYEKHLMVVTRGTRGDVQPFLALSRGLAEIYNWQVTIVTEVGHKGMVNSQTDVSSGAIQWRPSGGDTTKKVQAKLSQKAINLKINAKQTNVMQNIFLARSEVEFFPSEPAIFHWAQSMKPDYLMFGFTMATVTAIVSEALKIPIMGFVLQPTSIPSSSYPPTIPLREEVFNKLTDDEFLDRHDNFKLYKFIMESLELPEIIDGHLEGQNLNSMRKRRGLEEHPGNGVNIWQELKEKNLPLIIPINETMFGGKPEDWSENAVFTDGIFLRGGTVPPIAPDAQKFLDDAKAGGGKIVVLAFSSMPVSKSQIVSISLQLIRDCREKVCVFALVGGQMNLPLENNIEKEAQEALDTCRLFLAGGAPFGRLFPLVDTVVLHGGLGTTSEALQAEVPAIVTGVLLLDQRFWGARCSQLNVGPFGTHIDDFPDVCVQYVDKALAEDSEWCINAKGLGQMMKEQSFEDPSGVKRNAECVVRMSKKAMPYIYENPIIDGKSEKKHIERVVSYIKGFGHAKKKDMYGRL